MILFMSQCYIHVETYSANFKLQMKKRNMMLQLFVMQLYKD
jgi:hypothetical protein